MTLLGVPEFNIGTSSTTAPAAAASGGGMDMSLGKLHETNDGVTARSLQQSFCLHDSFRQWIPLPFDCK